ncbi:hypothetical protein [Streptococcus suis]|uniref:hypothetical protein n=1 Tax=Streptococcus suis TaxID=1307 RepID=UPI001C0AFF1E|nr:hypothetical protein [Streptococcus suis]QWS32032.1 hypothetical protein KPA27_04885 [Streptococcus suis]
MKYLTEDDLRLIYRDNPFETFTIQNQTRLTPGAKTFLMDCKVKIIDEGEKKSNRQTSTINDSKVNDVSLSESNDWLLLRSELLQVAFEVMNLDFSISEELCALEQSMSSKSSTKPIQFRWKDQQKMNKSDMVEYLSRVRLLLKTRKGKIASYLFPLYFKFQAFSEKLGEKPPIVLQDAVNYLAGIIIDCINRCEEVGDDLKKIT